MTSITSTFKVIAATMMTVAAINSSWAQKITVVTEEYPPYNFTGSDKTVSGMSTEVVKEAFKRAKVDYDLQLLPWARAYQTAQSDQNVAIYSIGRSESREALFKWVDVIAPYNVYFYKLKSNSAVSGGDLSQITKYKIGGVRDDVRAQFLLGKKFKLDLVTSDSINIKKLREGRIDAFPIDEAGMAALIAAEKLNAEDFEKLSKIDGLSSGLFLAFSKQTSDDVVSKVKVGLKSVVDDGTFDKIKAKYLK